MNFPADAVKWWKEDIKNDEDREPMITVLGDANGFWGVCDNDDCLWAGPLRYDPHEAREDAKEHAAKEHTNE